MQNEEPNMSRHRASRSLLACFIMCVLLAVCSGASCDAIVASDTFRDAAASSIGSGVRDIVNGILDGLIALVEQAGDGGTSTSG
jgi:hypothetical protein